MTDQAEEGERTGTKAGVSSAGRGTGEAAAGERAVAGEGEEPFTWG